MTKFVLTMNGGKRGLLTNTKPPLRPQVLLEVDAQGPERQAGAQQAHCRLQVPACNGKGKRKKRG